LDTFHAFSIISIATYVFYRYSNYSILILNRLIKLILCFYRSRNFVECQIFQIINGASLESFEDEYSFSHVFILYLRDILHQIIVCDEFSLFYV